MIKCMVMESLHGEMVGVTKANTKMIKNMDLVHSPGKMGKFIQVNGEMDNNMEKVKSLMVNLMLEGENGKMER